MTTATIAEKVASIVKEIGACHPDAVTQDAKLDDLGIESLDLVEIATEVEDVFGITAVDDSVLVELKTVGDISRMVEKLVAAK